MIDTIEGNRLIAEFMEIQRSKSQFADGTHGYLNAKKCGLYHEDELEYRSSWDWLMPVVEKIHILREVTQVSIRPGSTRIWLAKGSFIQSPVHPENNSITECWLAVVEFIKQYNQNKRS